MATYKFALLQSLAGITIEQGEDSEASLAVSTDAIAEKFVRYYWRQVLPYPAAVDTRVLQQNAGRQAAVLNVVRRARATLGDSLGCRHEQRSRLEQACPGGCRGGPDHAAVETPDGGSTWTSQPTRAPATPSPFVPASHSASASSTC